MLPVRLSSGLSNYYLRKSLIYQIASPSPGTIIGLHYPPTGWSFLTINILLWYCFPPSTETEMQPNRGFVAESAMVVLFDTGSHLVMAVCHEVEVPYSMWG